MEKVAMNNTSDFSGIYRPTADAPRYCQTTAGSAGGRPSHSASAPNAYDPRLAPKAAPERNG